MKYQIIEYDDFRKFVYVQAAETEEELATSQKLPISLNGITSKSDFEKLVYVTWQFSIPKETPRTFDDELMSHIIANTSTTTVIEASIEILSEEIMQDVAPEPGAVQSDTTATVTVL
jgi:hypothetical protein